MKRLCIALTAILSPALGPSYGFAKGSVDAIRLENIPLDASVDCSRTFFRSTQNFNGTIYVMPRVVPEAHGDEHPVFEIESDGKGQYNLLIGLYFPRNEEQIPNEWDTDPTRRMRCNFDVVKAELNKDLPRDGQEVQRIAPMPLTSIEVRVPGVSKTGQIGRSFGQEEEVDLLDYDGKSLPIEIPISAEERDAILRRMVRRDGIPVQVRLRFQARSREGSVSAKIDWRQLSSALSIALSGKRWITAADLEAVVKANIKNTSQNIVIEAGTSASFEKISASVVEKIMAQAEAFNKGENPTGNTKLDVKPADGPLLNVKTLLEATASQGASEIRIEQSSAPEAATAETIVRFRTKLRDPELREVRVRAGFVNPSFDKPILAGDTIRITPAYHFLARYSFEKTTQSYLTESQIRELRLAQSFPDIASDQMVIKNTKLGQNLVAVGRWVPLAGYSPVYSPHRYLWRRTERIREIMPEFSKALSPGLENLRKLPIELAFSNIGGRSIAHLADAIGDHPLWTATYDASGTIELTAKQDLGLLTFVERFKRDGESIIPGEKDLVVSDMVMDSVVEEKHSPTKAITEGTRVELKRDPITITQSRFVVFHVSHRSRGTAPASEPPSR